MSREIVSKKTSTLPDIGKNAVLFPVTVLLILFTCVISLYTDDLNFHFNHINNRDGLPHNTVNCVIQDREGFLWIGTEKGICRYDGYSFVHYPFRQQDEAAGSPVTVNTMMLDRSGSLWVGTNGGGLIHFQSREGMFETYLSNPEHPGDPVNKVFAIVEDGEGVLWIGTMGNGLFSFRQETETYSRHPLPVLNNGTHENTVNVIYPYAGGDLLAGTSSGLFKFDPVRDTAVSLSSNVSAGKALPVITVFVDSRKRIWTGTSAGVFMLDRQSEQLVPSKTTPGKQLEGTTVNTFHEDRYGRIWIGSWNGLYIIDGDGEEFTKFSSRSRSNFDLTSRFITDIFEDRSGVIWVSTTNGLNKYNLGQGDFRYYDLEQLTAGEMDSGLVLSVMEEKEGILWIGLFNGGLVRYKRSDKSCICYSESSPEARRLTHNSVMDIQSDGQGRIYIGTLGGGVNVLRDGREQITHYIHNPRKTDTISNDYVSSILVLKPDQVLVGTWNGLNLFNPVTDKFRRFYIPDHRSGETGLNRIGSVFRDSGGRIWVGTLGGGLYKFISETGKFIPYGNPGRNGDSENPNLMYGIRESLRGNLWVASFNGLLHFDPSQDVRSFGDPTGTIKDSVWDILEDRSGNFWLSTSMGITRMDPVSGDMENFAVNDEIFINFMTPGNGCRGAGNDLFFAGEGGVLSFDPRKVSRGVSHPRVVITSGSAFHDGIEQVLPLEEKINHFLSHNNDLISFQFSTFNFPNPAKSKYRYRLWGNQESWVDLGRKNTVSFSNLAPGSYQFQVKGSNGSGTWSKNPAVVHFRIFPPFWGTWWFRGLALLMMLSLLMYFHLTRLERLKRKLTREEKIRKLFEKSGISRREEEIAFLLLEGKTSRQIEDILFISNGTVRNHIYSIYKKLDVKNRLEFANLFKDFNHRSSSGPVSPHRS